MNPEAWGSRTRPYSRANPGNWQTEVGEWFQSMAYEQIFVGEVANGHDIQDVTGAGRHKKVDHDRHSLKKLIQFGSLRGRFRSPFLSRDPFAVQLPITLDILQFSYDVVQPSADGFRLASLDAHSILPERKAKLHSSIRDCPAAIQWTPGSSPASAF
jgi:hypothetical protein